MNTFLSDLKKFDEDVNDLAREYLDMQITCMMLHHAGCVKIAEGDVKNGNIIIGFVKHMRESVDALYKSFIQSLGETEASNAFARIGYDTILYSSVSDDIIKSNAAYFTIAARSQSDAYRCDIVACNKRMESELQQYFSPLWE